MTEHIPQRKLRPTPTPATKPAPAPKTVAPLVHHATASGGSALDAKMQREMGSRFGHDFSQVRIHTSARAAESAQTLGANAYAVGSDIVFGPGRYAPGSTDGDRLIAHELTHVVQQATFGPGDPSRASRRGDASEQEAEAGAEQVLAGQTVQVRYAPATTVQCYQAPDQEWNTKHDNDERMAHLRELEIVPGLGNAISGIGALGNLGIAGYDALTGDDKGAEQHTSMAENQGLNAIPWFGNARAAKQAKGDVETVRRDERGVPAKYNPNSEDQWEKYGQGNFNKSVSSVGSAIGSVWDDFF